jgi:spermidine/putrescine transport system permease protein
VKILSKCYIGLIFFLLYIPILVLIVFSFNESGSLAEFSGFSLVWYQELFHDEEAFSALRNSLVLAICSSLVATVLGTFGALGLYRMRNRYLKEAVNTLTNIPMMNPDIVTGVSMMLLFVGVVTLLGTRSFFGFGTLLIAHVTFNLPYVLLSVMPRFKQLDKSLSEAAQDLGCTPSRAFFKVELPQIVPGILSGLMMSFTLSLDDFVISHFVSSPNFQTLPLYIYNQTAHNVKFSMYALSALIVAVILVILLVVNFAGSATDRKASKKGGTAA